MYRLNEKLKALKPYDPVEGRDMIHLDANESFLPLPPALLEAAKAAVERTAFHRYPDPSARALCEAFGAYYGVPAENVAAGNGSDELITVLFSGFLQKGEAFATLQPDFSMYAFNGTVQEARHVPIPRVDFCLEIDGIIETCRRENVRLLIFSNPCNPTSIVCHREGVRRLVRGLGQTDCLVVLDEAYMDFSDQSLLPEFADYDNLIILRTCSKAMGMAALRLGFAVARKELIDAVKAVKSPYNVNSVSQAIGTAVLQNGAALDRALAAILRSRDELYRGLDELEQGAGRGRFGRLAGETNFAALVMPDKDAAYRYLWEKKIAVRDTGGLLRVTCGTTEENRAFLQAFEDYLKSTG